MSEQTGYTQIVKAEDVNLEERNAIVVGSPPASHLPSKQVINRLIEVSNAIAKSGIPLPKSVSSPEAVFSIVLLGWEHGLAPMTSLYQIAMVEGKPCMSAALKVSIVRARGVGTIDVVESSAQRCVVEVTRKSWEPTRKQLVEFTWEDATRAELTGRNVWKKYPKSMLVARATDLAVHTYFQDVFSGVPYSPEELGADTDESGNVVDAKFEVVDRRPPWVKEGGEVAGVAGVVEQAPVAAKPAEPEVAKEEDRPPWEEPEKPADTLKAAEDAIKADVAAIADRVQVIGKDNYKGVLRMVFKLETIKGESDTTIRRVREHLDKLVTLITLRDWALDTKVMTQDQWRTALAKRGVKSKFCLMPDELSAIVAKLFDLTIPSDWQALGLEPASPKAVAG